MLVVTGVYKNVYWLFTPLPRTLSIKLDVAAEFPPAGPSSAANVQLYPEV